MIPKDAYAIIIGSMKSGTTALYNYLIEHPHICGAVYKEPEFFSENQGHALQIDNYEKLWNFNTNKHKIALEASTGYTKYPSEPNVPRSIYNYGIQPKFIYIVRNPIDRILSQYQHVISNENWSNNKIVSSKTISLSSYFLQLSKFRQYFPKENILIVSYDELSKRPGETVSRVFKFLEIDRFYLNNYKIYNKTNFTDPAEALLSQKYPSIYNLLPETAKNKIFNLSFSKKAMDLLRRKQIKTLRKKLRGDMKKFQDEYGFDVSEWGF